MYSIKKITAILSILFLFHPPAAAQGKIINKQDADERFGMVKYSLKLDSGILNSLTEQSSSVLMLNILNSGIIISDNKRKILYSEVNYPVNSETEFHVFNISVIRELLRLGGSPYSSVELRENVLTVTNGEYTMEFSVICPPFCSW